ncbi:MAG: HupE/UreJ family protein [Gammaproteobacteria bacterium]|nr:MAG: HupE/UreJ family protein [Gammaproteobacteria bacterium]
MHMFRWWAVGCLLMVSGVGSAHTIRPAVVTATFANDATFALGIRTNVEALAARVSPKHADTNDSPNAAVYNQLRTLSPEKLKQRFQAFSPEFIQGITVTFDGVKVPLQLDRVEIPEAGDIRLARKSMIYLRGAIPPGASRFVWRYPEEFGSSVLRLRYPDGKTAKSYWLKEGRPSPPFELAKDFVPRSRAEVIADYTVLGFTHILPLGLDHILFVLGIFLLCLQLGPILWQVTAFTVAHTITLGLSIYGIISLSPTIVEPLIAASIVYVGVENVITGTLKPWRVVVVFLFGLLHGMGFAGVLTEIGLPRSEFLTALIAFNVGVEFGQLAVIVTALAAVGWFRNREWYRQRVVIPVSLLISLVGLYWTIQRIA